MNEEYDSEIYKEKNLKVADLLLDAQVEVDAVRDAVRDVQMYNGYALENSENSYEMRKLQEILDELMTFGRAFSYLGILRIKI